MTLGNTSGASQAILTNNPQTWNATGGLFNLTFAGPNSLSMGTGAVTPTSGAAITITSSAGTLIEGGAIAGGTASLTVDGPAP